MRAIAPIMAIAATIDIAAAAEMAQLAQSRVASVVHCSEMPSAGVSLALLLVVLAAAFWVATLTRRTHVTSTVANQNIGLILA
ncbi:hypothetical protein [Sphingomonas sp. UYP23]